MPDQRISSSVAFENDGEAAKINYSVPLPGSHTGRRLVALDLGLQASDFLENALKAGEDLAKKWGLFETTTDGIKVNESAALRFFQNQLSEAGLGSDSINISHILHPNISDDEDAVPIEVEEALIHDIDSQLVFETISEFELAYREFLRNLRDGIVMIPTATWSGGITLSPAKANYADAPGITPIPGEEPAKQIPSIFVIEHYGVSSFLGDYGMGKTVKTLTLLPGEKLKLYMKTWQSSKQSIKEASSIIDSHEKSAKDRFSAKVQSETTDKSTKSSAHNWNVNADAKANWGWGSAKVSGSGGGKYQKGREQFGKRLGESVKEHASEASSKRQLSVNTSSEQTEEVGAESVIEREIVNVNMRRVLNFVFRELNQEYSTKVHLKGISIAYTDGTLNSWREVPLSGLYDILEEILIPAKVQEIAQMILTEAGFVFDKDDATVNVLQKVEISQDGSSLKVAPAKLGNDGKFSPLSETLYYRFKSGHLNQDDQKNPVDGVLLSEEKVVMRTDSVAVEALLGQSDALDAFSMEIQQAEATGRTMENEREHRLFEILAEIPDPEKRAEMAVKLFGKNLDIDE